MNVLTILNNMIVFSSLCDFCVDKHRHTRTSSLIPNKIFVWYIRFSSLLAHTHKHIVGTYKDRKIYFSPECSMVSLVKSSCTDMDISSKIN